MQITKRSSQNFGLLMITKSVNQTMGDDIYASLLTNPLAKNIIGNLDEQSYDVYIENDRYEKSPLNPSLKERKLDITIKAIDLKARQKVPFENFENPVAAQWTVSIPITDANKKYGSDFIYEIRTAHKFMPVITESLKNVCKNLHLFEQIDV